jgi:hypothetical protein
VKPTSAARTRRGTAGLGLALLLGLFAPARHAVAAESGQDVPVIYHNSRSFRIPFNINPAERRRIKEVLLCVSEDRGLTWKPVSSKTTPDRGVLAYRAPSDGEYWFAVQTLDDEGRLYPPDTADIEPRMKVFVDTVRPTLTLQSNGRRGTVASVRWDAQDERLERNSFILEYQSPGATDWRKVPVSQPIRPIGEATWDAGTADAVRVRAQVSDRAQNAREVTIDLTDGVPQNPAIAKNTSPEGGEPAPLASFASSEVENLPAMSDPPPTPPPSRPTSEPAATRPAAPPAASTPIDDLPTRRNDAPPARSNLGGTKPGLVANPKFNLQYAVEDAGPDGPATVELWVTQDGGRTWRLAGTDPDRKTPFPVDLGGEGTFGLKIVAKSASDLGDTTPVPGERPTFFVEVDSTRPRVKLDRVRVDTRGGVATLGIDWRASDFNLGLHPVEVLIRPDTPGAKWQRIGQPVANDGHATWTVPANAPVRFYVRVEVTDEAGNRDSDETPPNNPVIVDRTRPKGKILGLEPVAREPSATAIGPEP